MPVLTEADTCRLYVLPKLYAADWTDEQISEQKSFTDGRIVIAGSKVKRRPQKRADYLLQYRCDFPIAVVEAKAIYSASWRRTAAGERICADSRTEVRRCDERPRDRRTRFPDRARADLDGFPSADELWGRLRAGRGH